MLLALKSLIVLVVLGWFAWRVGPRAVSLLVGRASELAVYPRLAVGVVIAAFLAGNFWLYTLAAGGWLTRFLSSVHPAALLVATAFVTPYLSLAINGVGPLDHLLLFKFQYLVIWMAAWLTRQRLPKQPQALTPAQRMIDWFAFGWVVFQVFMSAGASNVTNAVRVAVYEFTETYLVIYVMSRSVRSSKDLRLVIAVMLLSFGFQALVACFETLRHWLLYSGLASALGVPKAMGGYLAREGTGLLRAQGSTGHPIVLGAMAAVGACLSLTLIAPGKPHVWARIGLATTLLAGLIASISRGPWAAAVVALLAWAMLPPVNARRLAAVIGSLLCVVVMVLLLPGGQKVIDLLPWVGNVESFNVDYRERLLQVSWIVFLENPWLGSVHYLDEPIMQTMIQGEGIVDIVNTYVAVALRSGAIGLVLYAGPLWVAMGSLLLRLRRDPQPEFRALMAALVCISVTIATVSPVSFIPMMLWSLVGLAAAVPHVEAWEPSQ